MIYFYLWVAVLASVIFAVPVAAFMEKSRNKKAAGLVQTTGATSEADDAVAIDEESPVAEMADDGMDGFGASTPADADDFSAFDDFK